MKSPLISELEPNQPVSGVFLVRSKDVRQKKSGDPYLSLVVGDRTGEMDAKMWDNVGEALRAFERDDFVRIKGVVSVYQNRLQLTIHKVQRLEDSEVNLEDFFPVSSRDPDEMAAELGAVIADVGNPHLKALLEAMFSDPQIAELHRRAPAAKSVHHAWFGGLLEHVLSVCRLCRLVGPQYPGVDIDLLLSGALLHDIGKIHELNYRRSFGYTSEGQLLGHIAIGMRMIGEKLQGLPDFPPRLRTLVEHMVLSHHGRLEFGSPRQPLFPEALLLHYLDDLDSKLDCMRSLIAHDPQLEGEWTSYSQPLDRSVLKKLRYLDGAHAPELDAAEAPAAHKPSTPFGEQLFEALAGEGGPGEN